MLQAGPCPAMGASGLRAASPEEPAPTALPHSSAELRSSGPLGLSCEHDRCADQSPGATYSMGFALPFLIESPWAGRGALRGFWLEVESRGSDVWGPLGYAPHQGCWAQLPFLIPAFLHVLQPQAGIRIRACHMFCPFS